MLMSALLSSQQISAAAEAEVLFEESFAADEGSFTAEGVDIWYWAAGEHSIENGIRMKADRNDASAGTYFVSPEIALGTANTLRFRHCIENCWLNDFQARAGVFVRTKGGNWVEIPVFNYTDNFREPLNSGNLKVPAEFNGKKVQFAFKYVCDGGNNTCMWFINDFKVVVAEDENTGIRNINKTVIGYNRIYDLQGRIVKNPTNGIYVINVKKVVIK